MFYRHHLGAGLLGRLALLLAAGLATIPVCADAPPARCRYVKLSEMAMQFDHDQPTVLGSINGQPASLILDTGAANTSLFRAHAEKLQLPLAHVDLTSVGVGGESKLYRTRVEQIELGPLKADNAKLGVVWDAKVGNGQAGLFGADILFQRDVELVWDEARLRFFHPVGCETANLAYWDSNASVTPMQDMNSGARSDTRKLIEVVLNGKKIRALIDTGASTSVLDEVALRRKGLALKPGQLADGGEFHGIGQHAGQFRLATFDHLVIADEVFMQPRIPVADLWAALLKDADNMGSGQFIADQPEMILGADFIKAHRLLFAVSQRKLYFSHQGGEVFSVAPRWLQP